MSSLSIRNMNTAMRELEIALEVRVVPSVLSTEKSHYWHVQRKAKRGNKWIFVCEYFGTKSEAAAFWCKSYRGRYGFRLKHLMEY